MSKFNQEEFLKLKSKEQIAEVKKIDDAELLNKLKAETEYKTVKSAINDRVADLKSLENQNEEKTSKTGLTKEEQEKALAKKKEEEEAAKAKAEEESKPKVVQVSPPPAPKKNLYSL